MLRKIIHGLIDNGQEIHVFYILALYHAYKPEVYKFMTAIVNPLSNKEVNLKFEVYVIGGKIYAYIPKYKRYDLGGITPTGMLEIVFGKDGTYLKYNGRLIDRIGSLTAEDVRKKLKGFVRIDVVVAGDTAQTQTAYGIVL